MTRIFKFFLLTVLAAFFMTGCQLLTHDYRTDVLEYAMITDSDDLSKLNEYPNLEYVDLRGSTCYEAILAYISDNPHVTVRYNVALGEKRFDSTVTDIALNGYETDFDLLLNNVKYLPELKHIYLNQISFTREQLDTLTYAYPDIVFSYSVDLCGRKYENTITEIDLSHMTVEEVDEVINTISLLSQLRLVKLSSNGLNTPLALDHVTQMINACPGVDFDYDFVLFGKRVSTLDETLLFDSVKIGNEGVDELCNVLDIMHHCQTVKLDSCGIDNEVMEQLQVKYPDKNISWRVFIGLYSLMTDEEMIRMNNQINDKNSDVLKYCTKVKYMDLANSKITNIEFARNMPDLECVILTNTGVADLTPLSDCKNLTWLELYYCNRIKDLSAISDLNNLKYLNISGTSIADIESLRELPLERFSCVRSPIKGELLDTFKQMHPDCVTTQKGSALDQGWRYNDKYRREPFDYYVHMQEVFRYKDKTYRGNTKES